MTTISLTNAPLPAHGRVRRNAKTVLTGLAGGGWRRTLAALAGGYLVFVASAPSTRWWWAPIGLGLLALSVHGVRGRSGYGIGVLFGLSYFVPLLHWAGIYVGAAPWLALAVVEAMLMAIAVIFIAWAARFLPWWPLWAAAAWVAGEKLLSVVPFGGFAWGSVAFTQPDGPLLPVAALIGEAGLSFVTALAGFALAELVRRGWSARHAGWVMRNFVPAAVLLVAVAVLAPVSRLAMVDPSAAATGPHRTIAVIQGNVPKPGLNFNDRRRAVTDNHAVRTHQLAAAVRAGTEPKPDLVLWPENASDIDPYTNPDAAEVISAAVDDIGVPVLVGAVVAAPEPKRNYNMGILWLPGSGPSDQTYIKRRPVPFGEYMPMRSFFRVFSDKVDLLRSEFLPGTRPGTFDVAGTTLGDLICFEVVEDGLIRDVLRGGAKYLVVQTNNATFGWTDETFQQQAMSRIRAVEHGREVLIAATSGVSAVIRPDGSVESSVPMFTAGYLVASVPLLDGTSPGTVLGAPVEWLLSAAAPLALLLAAVWRRRRAEHDRDMAGITQEDTAP